MPEKNWGDREQMLSLVILAGVAAAALAYWRFRSRREDHLPKEEARWEITPYTMPEDPIPEVGPGDGLGRDCVVMAPWGKPLIVRFSPEQWDMVLALSAMTGVDIEEVVCEIAGDRYRSGGEGIITPPPWFESYLKGMFDDDGGDYDNPFGGGLF